MKLTDRESPYPNETVRLQRLGELAILDTPRESEFDTIVDLAHQLLDCPIALVSLIDDHRQWFKARCGLDVDGTPRDQAFCAHAILRDDIMVVPDATKDERFAANPLVTGAPHIRFYAGAPLRPRVAGGYGNLAAIGTLCVIGKEPRQFSENDRRTLRRLAEIVEGLVCARAATAAAIETSQMLERTNKQLGHAERLAGIGSWQLDLATGRIDWSEQVYAIHGLPVGEKPSINGALEFYPNDGHRERLRSAIEQAIASGEGYDVEADFVAATGAKLRVRAVGEVEFLDGKPVAVIGVLQDITDRFTNEQALERSANTDSLTGLPNRKMFEQRLSDLMRDPGEPAPYALLLIDLDGFKPVNDTLGHQAGDKVLQTVAGRLKGQHFAHAFAARLGGDEFVMIVTRPRDCAALPTFVQALLRELRHIVEQDGIRLAVTATVGAALWDGAPEQPSETLRKADLALYAAKRAQRGSGSIYGSDTKIGPWSILDASAV